MSATFISVTSMRLGDQNHHTSAAPATFDSTTASQVENQPSPHHTGSHFDRSSAIALGDIPIILLALTACFVHQRLKSRRQADLERQTAMERRDSVDVLRSYGARSRDEKPGFRMDRLWSTVSRQDSMPTDLESVDADEMKGPWTGVVSVRGSTCTSSGSISTPSHTSDESLDEHDLAQDGARSRSPSPHSQTQPQPRTRKASHHRRQSSICSIPDPLLADLQLQSRRSSTSSSTSQHDKRWWTNVAHHGSTAHADRRFSVLESIPEPHAVGVGESKRRKSEALWRRQRAREGSRYDWRRPSVGEVEDEDEDDDDDEIDLDGEGSGSSGSSESAECPGSSEMLRQDDFRGVVWDGETKSDALGEECDIGPAAVERLDWATEA